ncbi:MAG: hypothetical protein ACE5Z5_02400 [Candidatus Bathyarchaeia archaeon]
MVDETGLSEKSVECALRRLWRRGAILRSEKPEAVHSRILRGRAGIRRNLRRFHFYILNQGDCPPTVKGVRFVAHNGNSSKRNSLQSKASLILNFLKDNSDRAFFSKDIVEALSDRGVRPSDIMSNIRRYEDKGIVYVRGYRTHDGETPFKEGYMLTWIDQDSPRDQAIREAVGRTNKALVEKSATSPIIDRVHKIRDIVIASTELRDLLSFDFILNKLNCSRRKAEGAVTRALQLYQDLVEVKLFNNIGYFYHASMTKEDLKSAIEMKENYIRVTKGRANRIGHNWEAVVGWFIDRLTAGARFWTQKHRSNMDQRRVTIHLIKSVGGRRQNAEVDRVWEVTPGPLLQSTTYVLECKWGLVKKGHIDDFFNILRWSKEFGVDTPDGRQIKQGITGVFAGSSFDPRESVRLKDETIISLASYAARMNIQLLKATDFNEKLREKGVPKAVTVQKICRYARDEKEVREILEAVWENPAKSDDILRKTVLKNQEIYEFEKILELDPVERKVLDYVREHKGEIDVEKCAEELKLPLKKVEEVIKKLRKKGLLKD